MSSKKTRRIDSLRAEITYLDLSIRAATRRRLVLQGQLNIALEDAKARGYRPPLELQYGEWEVCDRNYTGDGDRHYRR